MSMKISIDTIGNRSRNLQACSPTEYPQIKLIHGNSLIECDRIKEDKMGEVCSTHWAEEKCMQIRGWKILKEINRSWDPVQTG